MIKAVLPEKLAGPRVFEFDFRNVLEKIDVCIQVPDLSDNSFELSGDWGPHYRVALKKNQMLRIGYKPQSRNDYDWFMFFPRYLVITSPMFYSVRQRSPFMYVIQDEANNLKFDIFVNAEGEVADVKTTTLGDFDRLRNKAPTLRAI